MLYYVLSKKNKKKVWGFIDNNDECLCSRLCLPIIHSDQIEGMEAKGLKAILLPSYTYLSMLREEAESWPASIDILDIYECFERNGIECREDFYIVSGTGEDYEVGFPFD